MDVWTKKFLGIPSTEIDIVVRQVAASLVGAVPDDDLLSAAGQGVALAIEAFIPSRIGPKDFRRRALSHLIQTGKRRAIDHLRSTKQLARFRNGRWYGGQVNATPFSAGSPSQPTADEDCEGRKITGFTSTPDYSQLGPAEAVEHRDMVAALLARLSEKEQAIYHWHFVEGVEFKEIAERLGVTPAAVYMTWAAALDKMRRMAKAA
jgi:RNA polymerase sigma factor (sigma-70 family)